MIKTFKAISIFCYLLITLPSIHFAAPLILFLVVGLLGGTLLGTTVAALTWVSIFTLIWTTLKPNIRRDKILTIVIPTLLNITLLIYVDDKSEILKHMDFSIPFALFLLSTVGYIVLTFRQKP